VVQMAKTFTSCTHLNTWQFPSKPSIHDIDSRNIFSPAGSIQYKRQIRKDCQGSPNRVTNLWRAGEVARCEIPLCRLLFVDHQIETVLLLKFCICFTVWESSGSRRVSLNIVRFDVFKLTRKLEINPFIGRDIQETVVFAY
jgi:hypothetical protein